MRFLFVGFDISREVGVLEEEEEEGEGYEFDACVFWAPGRKETALGAGESDGFERRRIQAHAQSPVGEWCAWRHA